MSTLEAIRYKDGTLEILDQLEIPHECKYISITTVQDAWDAIRDMKVRGAPAIAIVGSLSVLVALLNRKDEWKSTSHIEAFVINNMDHLRTARPTAVNMFEAADRFSALAREFSLNGATVEESLEKLQTEIEGMLEKDISDNKAIGKFGGEAIIAGLNNDIPGEDKALVITHCNTGSLATAGYGTALGVIRYIHEMGKMEQVYCTETRPYNQGARLTAFELVHEGIPATLICDSMVAFLMQQKKISAVVVGADRVVANGDTANKIGTYQLAVLANVHGVPFYVAAPSTSIDEALNDGTEIVIEERDSKQVTHDKQGNRVVIDGINVWNPAFDVTPARLITGIMTEVGLAVKEAGQETFDMHAFLAAAKAK